MNSRIPSSSARSRTATPSKPCRCWVDDRPQIDTGVTMGIYKLHDEFHTLDMKSGWEVPAGYPSGIQQKILSGSLDEAKKSGSRTRLLRFAPGVYTTSPFVHEYW